MSSADDITHYDPVEGYAGRLSYVAGDEVTLHVSSRAAVFDVTIHRFGARRELVWEATRCAGVEQSTPDDADARGCGWTPSLRFIVPASWRSGFYLVTFHPGDGSISHACFVVRGSGARALLVLATNTYQAYNTWGGRSLYTGATQVSFRRPFGRGLLDRPATERDDRKSRPTHRGEDPDVDGHLYQQYRYRHGYPGYLGSTGWFAYERRFVEWAEAEGVQLDYAISTDLGAIDLSEYDVIISAGHDEYWSWEQRDAIEAFVGGGGNHISMSGNTCFWQVRVEDGGDAMVCHKYSAHVTDPAGRRMTGMWSDPLVDRPETAFLGAGSAWGLYARFGQATPRGSGAFTVYRDDHWLFAGTGLRYGDLLGAHDGVVGYETVGCRLAFDDYQLPIAAGGDGTPPDIDVVAFTPASNLQRGEYPASIAALADQGDLEFIASRLAGRVDADSVSRFRHGNAVMVVCRPFGAEGGEVVTIGSTDWVFGLGDPIVAQVTRNALAHCMRDAAGAVGR